MVASAQQLASILASQAAAAGSAAGTAASSTAAAAPPGSGSSDGAAGAVDMQRLFRLLTLDTIGLTSLNKSFDALQLWQQQQQGAGKNNNGSSGGSSSGSSGGGGPLELEQLLVDLESAFLWQALQLPVPSEYFPHHPDPDTRASTAAVYHCFKPAVKSCQRAN